MTCCWSAKAFIFYWPFLLLPATLIWESKSSLFLELCDSFRCVRTMLQLNYCLTNWVCPPMPFKAGKWLAIRTPQPEQRLMNRGSIHQKSWKSSLTHGNLFARLDCHWKNFNSFSMKIERQPAAHLWGTSPTSDNMRTSFKSSPKAQTFETRGNHGSQGVKTHWNPHDFHSKIAGILDNSWMFMMFILENISKYVLFHRFWFIPTWVMADGNFVLPGCPPGPRECLQPGWELASWNQCSL